MQKINNLLALPDQEMTLDFGGDKISIRVFYLSNTKMFFLDLKKNDVVIGLGLQLNSTLNAIRGLTDSLGVMVKSNFNEYELEDLTNGKLNLYLLDSEDLAFEEVEFFKK